jgi:hypothetical protein
VAGGGGVLSLPGDGAILFGDGWAAGLAGHASNDATMYSTAFFSRTLDEMSRNSSVLD